MRAVTSFFAIFLCFLLTSCGLLPRYEGNAIINSKVTNLSKDVDRADIPIMPACVIALKDSPCFHPMFIGVGISGGGARAANFGLAAVNELYRLGIYDSVTALSSVSGGSLVAAAIAVRPIESEEDVSKLAEELRSDFLSSWVLHSLNPVNLIATTMSERNATSTLADVFDKKIFHGATYGDLSKFGPRNPLLYINASLTNPVITNGKLTTRGLNSQHGSLEGFTFTNEAFREMGSSLSALRIADAVAASGAYPGLFEPLTLQNFNAGIFGPANSEFLHITDGGASDNLGADALIRAYSEGLRRSQDMSCLLILIDAHVSNKGEQLGRKADTRVGPFDYMISSSLGSAFDALLNRRREDQLYELGIPLSSDHPHRFKEDVAISLKNYAFSGDGFSSVVGRSSQENNQFKVVGGKWIDKAQCAIWHISLDRLLELTDKGNGRRREAFFGEHSPNEYKGKSENEQRLIALDYFVNGIETNYKLALSGPGSCGVEEIQASLFEAARLLVAEDFDSLRKLTKWFEAHHRGDLAENIDEAIRIDSENGGRYVNVPTYRIVPPDFRSRLSSWVTCEN